MSVYHPRKRRPLSRRAVLLLRRIAAWQDAHPGVTPLLGDVVDRTDRQAEYGAIHALADRWLIVIDGHRLRIRTQGRQLLRTAYYRSIT